MLPTGAQIWFPFHYLFFTATQLNGFKNIFPSQQFSSLYMCPESRCPFLQRCPIMTKLKFTDHLYSVFLFRIKLILERKVQFTNDTVWLSSPRPHGQLSHLRVTKIATCKEKRQVKRRFNEIDFFRIFNMPEVQNPNFKSLRQIFHKFSKLEAKWTWSIFDFATSQRTAADT